MTKSVADCSLRWSVPAPSFQVIRSQASAALAYKMFIFLEGKLERLLCDAKWLLPGYSFSQRMMLPK